MPIGTLTEFGLSFVLTLVLFCTLLDSRAPVVLGPVGNWLAPLWVGLEKIMLVLVGYPYSGASMNPRCWLGPAIWRCACRTA